MSSKATAYPQEIISEINILRSNPSSYIKKLEKYIHYFTNDIIHIPNLDIAIETEEGTLPYIEAIEFLKTKKPVNKLIPSKALCDIAQEFSKNVINSENGIIDKKLNQKIIDKHGDFKGKFMRAMDFGGYTSEQVVINFLVCDGDSDRSQRDVLLDEEVTKIGVAFGKHNIYNTSCILVTCTEFNNTKDPDDIMVFSESSKDKEKIKKGKREKKNKDIIKKKYESVENNGEDNNNIFKLKRRVYAYENVPKENLPEGVASMTKSDTIIIEGGKRYKKIILNKEMLDGTKTTEESKLCLD